MRGDNMYRTILIALLMISISWAGCLSDNSTLESSSEIEYPRENCNLDLSTSPASLICSDGSSLFLTITSGEVTGCTISTVVDSTSDLTCDQNTVSIRTLPVGERLRFANDGCIIGLLAQGDAILECSTGDKVRLNGVADCSREVTIERIDAVFSSSTCNGVRVNYGIPTQGQTLQAELIGMYDHDAGTFGTLEIPAYDPVTERLFLVNVLEKSVDIVSVADPTNPVLVDRVDLSRIGEPNSIDIRTSDGILAIAVHRERDVYDQYDGIEYVVIKDEPLQGLIYFIDTQGNKVADVLGSYQPDAITFSSDGSHVLVANEGEPSQDYKIDPEGSVTIIDVSGPLSELSQDHVTHVSFNDWDDDEELLKSRGIRIFGPNNPTVSQDLEPEYITVSSDSPPSTAWAVMQEANAVAVIDIAQGKVTDILPLGFKPHSGGASLHSPQTWTPPNTGLSGLTSIGIDSNGRHRMLTHADGDDAKLYEVFWDPVTKEITDTGVEIDLQDSDGLDLEDIDASGQYIWMSDESIPALIAYHHNGTMVRMLVPEGTDTSNLPTVASATLPGAFSEIESNKGFEAITQSNGTVYAMTQSSLSVTGSTERWIRIIELNETNMSVTGVYLYPVELSDGVYSHGGKMDKVSALEVLNDDHELLVLERDSETGSSASKWIFRVNLEGATNLLNLPPLQQAPGFFESMDINDVTDVEVDVPDDESPISYITSRLVINEVTGKTTTSKPNPFDDGSTDSDFIEILNPTSTTVDLSGWTISDDSYSYTFPTGTFLPSGQMLFVYADDTNDGVSEDSPNYINPVDSDGDHHAPFKISSGGEMISLKDASGSSVDQLNVPALSQDTTYGRYPDGSTTLMIMGVSSPDSPNIGESESTSSTSAASVGLRPVQKMPFVDLGARYGEKPEGMTIIQKGEDTVIALVSDDSGSTIFGTVVVRMHPLDGSDTDGGYNPQPWPVMGMYMPDGVTHFTHEGESYLITGNEGDMRDWAYFNSSSGLMEIGMIEEKRLAALSLDPIRFPNHEEMKELNVLGRLNVPDNCGDVDNDGDLDMICGVGARSFAIWSVEDGLELVWDSGEELSKFSTDNGRHLVDEMNSRDDNKGIEPEGVKTGEIGDRRYAFISMERSFGVMVYDITDPSSPSFQQWLQVEGASNPEDMEFVKPQDSPTGKALLIVANEDSGTADIWELTNL